MEATTGRIGRGLKFGEPLVKREVRLPESLNTRLINAARDRKSDISDVLRMALDKELSEPETSPSRPSKAEPPSDFESTLRNVLSDVLVNSIPVTVDRVRRSRLESLAEELGFAHVEDLVQDLAFRAIENPKNAASFLFSGIEESAIVAVQTDEHRSKTRKTSKTSKAA